MTTRKEQQKDDNLLLAGGTKINQSYGAWLKQHDSSYTHVKYLTKQYGSTTTITPSNNNNNNRGGDDGKGSTVTEPPSGPATMAIHWTINKQSQKIHVAIVVSDVEVKWVGFGFHSEMGGMPGSDMLIFESQGQKLYDAHALAYEQPTIDSQQDWTLLSTFLDEDNLIIFEAERDLDTHDSMDRPFVDDSVTVSAKPYGTNVIVAWGDSDTMQHHGPRRCIKSSIQFFSKAINSNDRQDFDHSMKEEAEGSVLIQMKDIIVPTEKTTYLHICVSITDLVTDQGLPDDRPLHLIGYDALVSPLIHHMHIYQDTDVNKKCAAVNSILLGWSRGWPTFQHYHQDFARLLADESPQTGAGLGIPPKLLKLEIHVENPERIKGIIDTSSFRLYYTSKLRKYTFGSIELGDPVLALGGRHVGEGLMKHTFNYSSSLTHSTLPPQGINVVATFLHMHFRGLMLELSQTRNGKEIHMSKVEYFDSKAQSAHSEMGEYKILPGDSLEVRCYYNGHKNLKFGLGARKEMCYVRLDYYPYLEISSIALKPQQYLAQSLPSYDMLDRTFGVSSSINNSIATEIFTTETLHRNNFMLYQGVLLCILSFLFISRLWFKARMKFQEYKIVSPYDEISS